MAIRRLVGKHKISSQESLLYLLEQEGYALTQATLSRDIKALKIAKWPSHEGSYLYVLPQESQIKQEEPMANDIASDFITNGFVSIDFSGNMVVIKTKPAHASSIAAIIDSANPYEILGTIAGDDTIFIVIREGIGKQDLIKTLKQILPNLKDKLI